MTYNIRPYKTKNPHPGQVTTQVHQDGRQPLRHTTHSLYEFWRRIITCVPA